MSSFSWFIFYLFISQLLVIRGKQQVMMHGIWTTLGIHSKWVILQLDVINTKYSAILGIHPHHQPHLCCLASFQSFCFSVGFGGVDGSAKQMHHLIPFEFTCWLFLVYWFLHPFKWHQGFHGHSIWLPSLCFNFFFEDGLWQKCGTCKNVINVKGCSSGFWDFLNIFFQRPSYFLRSFPPTPKGSHWLTFYLFDFHQNLWEAFGTRFLKMARGYPSLLACHFPISKRRKKIIFYWSHYLSGY